MPDAKGVNRCRNISIKGSRFWQKVKNHDTIHDTKHDTK